MEANLGPQTDDLHTSDRLVLGASFRPHASSSLVDRWGPREEVDACPRARYQMVNLSTGLLAPSRCGSGSCLYCARVNAKQIKHALALASPDYLATLTGLSGVWQTDRRTVNRLTYYLRGRGSEHLKFGLAWAIEGNPRETGHHAHGWLWGDEKVEEAFQRRATQVGLGIVDLMPVTHHRGLTYPIKNAVHTQASLDEHRRLNGREVIHARNFWRDGDTKEPLTKETAITRATAIRRSKSTERHGAEDWIAVPSHTVGDGEPGT